MTTGPAPAVSVVIPTYNRPTQLARCLDALARVEAPPGGFEVVVVDDGSDAPLDDVVAGRSAALDLRLVRQANAGPASARNRGAEAARGRWIAFTDDDCVPTPRWLVALVEVGQRRPDALVGGATRNAVAGDRCAEASQLLIEHLLDHRGSQPPFFPSNNMAVPADVFRRLGGFDTDFPLAAGEDRELCDRWVASGRPLVEAADAVVEHHHALDLRRFWRQHHNYGRGAYRFHRSRSHRTEDGIDLEPPSFYLSLITSPFRAHRPAAEALALSGLLVVSQVANGVGFARELARERGRRTG